MHFTSPISRSSKQNVHVKILSIVFFFCEDGYFFFIFSFLKRKFWTTVPVVLFIFNILKLTVDVKNGALF